MYMLPANCKKKITAFPAPFPEYREIANYEFCDVTRRKGSYERKARPPLRPSIPAIIQLQNNSLVLSVNLLTSFLSSPNSFRLMVKNI